MRMTKALDLNNQQIVTLAVARLGGLQRAIDLEDIAIASYDIAPSRFCWKKYPDRIDLRSVYDALKDACRSNPPLLRGGSKRGYMLTPEGQVLADSIEEIGPAQIAERPRRLSEAEWIENERVRLQRTEAFRKWHNGKRAEITLRDLQEFLRINEYFPAHLRAERIAKIANAAKGSSEIEALLDYLLETFRKEIK